MAYSKAILRRRQMGNRRLFFIEINWKMAFETEIYVNFH